MLEKIERVARVKGIENDASKRFNRKRGRNDDGDKKEFEGTLNAAVKRNEDKARVQANSGVYVELRNTATHSLFYQMRSLDELLAQANY